MLWLTCFCLKCWLRSLKMTTSSQSGHGTFWKTQLWSCAFNPSNFAGISSRQPFLALIHGWVLSPDKTSISSGSLIKVEISGFLLSCWQRGHFAPQHLPHKILLHKTQRMTSVSGLGKISHFLQTNLFLKAIVSLQSISFSEFAIFKLYFFVDSLAPILLSLVGGSEHGLLSPTVKEQRLN